MHQFKILFLFIFLAVSTNIFAAQKNFSQDQEAIPGEFIVKVKAGQEEAFLNRVNSHGIHSSVSMTSQVSKNISNIFKIEMADGFTGSVGIAQVKQQFPEIEVIEPNFIYRMTLQTPTLNERLASYAFASGGGNGKGKKKKEKKKNKDFYNVLWGLENTGDNEPADSRGNNTDIDGIAGADVSIKAAWEVFQKNHDVKIAVIDTGVDYNHPDLVQNILVNEDEIPGNGIDDDGNGYIDDVFGYDFLNNDADPMDDHGHGTHCSGTIAGVDNNFGVVGVIKDAKILPIKFLGPNGGSLEGAIKSIDYARERGVDIMSNSWGGGGYSSLLKDAIQQASDAGIVFVAAAGNHAGNNDERPSYPATYDVKNVISVAAHNYGDKLTSFSCYGKETVHISAPGRNILSTTPKTEYTDHAKYSVWSGTSMATPHVSGAIALLIAQEGRLDVEEVRHRVMETSVKSEHYSSMTAAGRLDAHRLLENIRD